MVSNWLGLYVFSGHPERQNCSIVVQVGSLNGPIRYFSSNVFVIGTDEVIASANDSTSASVMPVSGSAVLQQGALDSASAINRNFPDTC